MRGSFLGRPPYFLMLHDVLQVHRDKHNYSILTQWYRYYASADFILFDFI